MAFRRMLAVVLTVPVAVLFVGVLGQLPRWGETGPVALVVALLGIWAVGTVAFGRRA